MTNADYQIVDNFIPKETCDLLRGYKDRDDYDDNFFESSEKVYNLIKDQIGVRFNKEVHLDNFIIRSYSPSDSKNGMNLHLDNINWTGPNGKVRNVESRIYTTMITLNSNFIGGDFLLEDRKIHPATGRLTILKSELLHGVDPLIMGTRYSMLFWMRSDPHVRSFRECHL